MPRRIILAPKPISNFGVTTPNIVQGNTANQTTTAFSLTRVFYISNITGPAEMISIYAMNAPGVPSIGDSFSGRSDIIVTNVRSESTPGSPYQATVTVDYGPPSGAFLPLEAILEISSTLQPTETNLEIDNEETLTKKLIIIEYQKLIDPAINLIHFFRQTGTVSYMAPMDILRYSRLEQDQPYSKSRVYKGHINSKPILGDPPHFWLCTRLDGTTNDGAETWNVSYEFQRNIDSWDADLSYHDPETGRVPKEVTVANGGIRTGIRIYPEADFLELELTV